MSLQPIMSIGVTRSRNAATSAASVLRRTGRMPGAPTILRASSTPLANNATMVAPVRCFGGSGPAQIRKRMAGLDKTFLITFSMPIFSVSTLPLIHRPAISASANVAASSALPSVATRLRKKPKSCIGLMAAFSPQ
jgi:hypothetical protein